MKNMETTFEQNNSINIGKQENKEDINEFGVKRKMNPNIEYSESVKLKDLKDSNEIVNNNNNNINNQIKSVNLNQKSQEIENQNKKLLEVFQELKNKVIYTNEIKKYGNSILIGSFCHSIAFITFGIYKSRLIQDEYTNNWSVMALFGGLGQMTAGIMELIKGREFPSFLYLFYGFYCFSHFILRTTIDRFGRFDLCIYYIACLLLSIPLIIYSIKINLIYLLQSIIVSLYFFFNSIGEGIDEYILIEQVAGSLQIISGLLSIYLFFSQALNPNAYNCFIRTFPFEINNKIDFNRIKLNKVHKN